MVIDTSAVAAIFFDEPDAAAFEGKIADDPVRLMSAATVLEAAIVIEARLGDAGDRERSAMSSGAPRHRAFSTLGGPIAGPFGTTAPRTPQAGSASCWRPRTTSHCCSRATISQRPM